MKSTLRILLLATLFFLTIHIAEAAGTRAPEQSLAYFTGRIGDYPMQMELDLMAAEGLYFYENGGATLSLTGTNLSGTLHLKERTPGSKVTGHFVLSRSGTNEMSGNWQSPDRKRRLDVHLTCVAWYVTQRDDSSQDYCHTDLTWPVLAGTNAGLPRLLDCQAELRQDAAEFRRQCKQTLADTIRDFGTRPVRGYYLVGGTKIRYYSATYICPVQERWEHWGNMGMSDIPRSVNYLLRNGEVVQIELFSILRARNSSVRLAEMATADLRRQLGGRSALELLLDQSDVSLRKRAWAWRRGGLVIFFADDEFLPDGEGPTEVFLDNTGRLKALLKDPDALRALGLPIR